jgi:hypothetical protein
MCYIYGMLHFEKCPKPEPSALAKNTPLTAANAPTIFNRTLEHFHYWKQRWGNADTIGDIAVSGIASQLFHLFGNTKANYSPSDTRKYLLGLLAQSQLCRHIFGGEMTELYNFNTSNPASGAIIPEYGVRSLEGGPLDPRLHVSGDFIDEFIGPAGGGPSTWYKASDLYVRRTARAKPSVEFNDIAEQQGFSFDYSPLQTLFPYIAHSTF